MAVAAKKKTRARGWERKKANRDTYEEILEAAAKAFSSNGYEGTSLAEIATAVGIKTPALYYHFKSKNEILYAYLVRSGGIILGAVDRDVQAAGENPVDALKAYVRSYIKVQLEMLDTMPMVNTVIFGASISKALTRAQIKWVRDWERQMLVLLREILERGKSSKTFNFKDTTPTAFFIMGSIDFVVNWYRPGGKLGIDQLADQYADLALKSVGR